MTNIDDPLIAEIDKMIATHSHIVKSYGNLDGVKEVHDKALEVLERVQELVKADRARQQAEKEKMIAELEAYKPTREQQLDNPLLSLGMTSGMIYAIEVIQGKEQKENREASK